LVLQLDHIDGDRSNNTIDNLRLLCPNCHTQTPTFGAKRRKKRCEQCGSGLVKGKCEQCGVLRTGKNCIKCGNITNSKTQKCKICIAKERASKTKISWPETSDLIRMVDNSSCLAVSKILGVSDKAIVKRIKNHPATIAQRQEADASNQQDRPGEEVWHFRYSCG
jgi:hypothetical protein